MKAACVGRSVKLLIFCEIYFVHVLIFDHPFFVRLQKRLYRPTLILKSTSNLPLSLQRVIVILDIDTISTTDLNCHTLYQEEHEALPISHTLV